MHAPILGPFFVTEVDSGVLRAVSMDLLVYLHFDHLFRHVEAYKCK